MHRIGWLCILTLAVFIEASHQEILTSRKDFQDTLGHLGPRTSAQVQTVAAEKLLIRLLGKDASLFQVNVDPDIKPLGKDTFMLNKVENLNKVEINGTSGVAVAWGLYYYLKHYCNCHISWEGTQLKLPNVLPEVNETVTSNDRYYQNVCTFGYSSVWWQWEKWEKNIDWMALNGINLALAFNAQEAIWERVYLNFNLSKQEIGQHFGGPAFLPWTRMGNIRGWGGPLTDTWHENTIKLQHLILNRMRELGIIPVLPAFAGHVPRDFLRVFPDANVTKVPSWNDFDDQYCCPYILEPTSPLFQTVGEEFLKKYIDEFGTDNIYNCDSFNENTPHTGDPAYLRATGKAIYSTMSSVDPKAIWLMQGWLFKHDSKFWNRERVKAYVTSVPIGKMIILDLQSEQFPLYEELQSYYGQPFIWCMLHNFGGTLGMFGSSTIVNKRVFYGRSMINITSTMVGTGLTPEGINQNYVIYELMNEMAYRKEPANLDDWFANYALRRYGTYDEFTKKAWQELGRTVYDYQGFQNIRGHYVITRRPSFNIKLWYWYDLKKFYLIWENFVRASNDTANSDLYKHDIVDISRQALQITADFIYRNITAAYKQKNLPLFQSASAQLLELLDDLEEVLASSGDFLLGRWLEAAKAAAPTGSQQERDSHEFNARNQITLWGPTGEIVDYANKQWSGVVSDYFRPRWQLFLEEVIKALKNKENPRLSSISRQIFNGVELPFTYSKKIYPTEPTGDSKQIADEIFKKWHVLWI